MDTKAPRKNQPRAKAQDWHPADIVAALRKAGWSLRRLSAHHGYAPQSLRRATDKPWPIAEAKIAEAIGVPPQRIWPSRYDADGRPKRGRPVPSTDSLDVSPQSAQREI
jgi:Ner family transcriptional regulator